MIYAFICDAVRTPIGRYGGSLSSVRTDDLSAISVAHLLRKNPSLNMAAIDEVFLGCANQAGEDNRNVARMALLLAGLPESVPGVTVNRLCGSGAEAVGQAARAIQAGEIDMAIAGGVESMSRAPYVLGKSAAAFDRSLQLEDTTMGWRFVNPVFRSRFGVDTMPQTAETLARERGISRADQDAFSLRSHQRAVRAQQSGFFAAEIVPVSVSIGKGDAGLFMEDEHPRKDASLERLAVLRSLFPPDGTVSAGNSSGINDGAAAMIVASEAAAARNGLKVQARCLGMATAGVEPRIMGIGPVPAVRKLLARLKLSIGDFDTIEINEAFAAQSLAVLRDLGLPDDAQHVNPNGGAIALGHPLGMSGARLVQTAVHQLGRTSGKRALVAMCIGVGQGIALAFERV
ncbi:3-oxoadipyl-CoA thiolase [Solimonas soli]|uniref:3-oxoadipyl-CoA thiolase n=1 Tax=Solimonas soli TaxID=413479 RepID=UPI0004869EEF|nr:3-oxoadipyl-CoA thiolase [Solimonas soli]